MLTRFGSRCGPCTNSGHRSELNTARHRELSARVTAGLEGPCRVCGAEDDLTVAHDVPRIHGGTLDDGWGVECRSCNSSAGAALRALD